MPGIFGEARQSTGILRLHEKFALRTSHSAQDDIMVKDLLSAGFGELLDTLVDAEHVLGKR